MTAEQSEYKQNNMILIPQNFTINVSTLENHEEDFIIKCANTNLLHQRNKNGKEAGKILVIKQIDASLFE